MRVLKFFKNTWNRFHGNPIQTEISSEESERAEDLVREDNMGNADIFEENRVVSSEETVVSSDTTVPSVSSIRQVLQHIEQEKANLARNQQELDTLKEREAKLERFQQKLLNHDATQQASPTPSTSRLTRELKALAQIKGDEPTAIYNNKGHYYLRPTRAREEFKAGNHPYRDKAPRGNRTTRHRPY